MTQKSTPTLSHESEEIKNQKLNQIWILSQSDFLKEASTHYGRVILADSLWKPVENINNLTAFFDLLRVEGITPKLSESLVKLGIAGVQDLRKQNPNELFDYFLWLHQSVEKDFSQADITRAIHRANNTQLVTFDLHNKKLAQDSTKYATLKKKQQQEVEYIRYDSKKEFISFCLQCIWFIALSYFSAYFLLFIPILLAFHIYKNSYFIANINYNVRKFIEESIYENTGALSSWLMKVQDSLTQIKNFSCISVMVLWTIIFFFGVTGGHFMNQIRDVLPEKKPQVQEKGKARYLSQEVFDTFDGREITRAEILWVLILSTPMRENVWSMSDCFGDISSSQYAEQICYAKNRGIVSGDANNNFNPNWIVTNGAWLKFILNFYEANVPRRALYITYNDITPKDWFSTYAEYAKSHGIIPRSQNEFHPNEAITIETIDRYIEKISEMNQN